MNKQQAETKLLQTGSSVKPDMHRVLLSPAAFASTQFADCCDIFVIVEKCSGGVYCHKDFCLF